jgi:hypothetical protein
MRDALDRDKSIVELRALLASYEERLSRTPIGTPEGHAALGPISPSPCSSSTILRSTFALRLWTTVRVIDAPGIVDCFKPEEPEPFGCVYKVASGVFRVHPRRTSRLSPSSGRSRPRRRAA